jgi:hypothetical protein
MLTLFFLAAHLQQRCWSLAEHSKLLVESIEPGGRVSTTQFRFISAHKSKTYRLRTAAYVPAHEVRQFRDVGGDPPRLVASQELRRRP